LWGVNKKNNNPLDSIKNSDVLIVGTFWPEFKKFTNKIQRISKKKLIIIDPDNNLKNVDTNQNYNVVDNLSSNNLNNYQIFIIVENYNILRFLGGIVGIAYTYWLFYLII
jgi:hypothetical protein